MYLSVCLDFVISTGRALFHAGLYRLPFTFMVAKYFSKKCIKTLVQNVLKSNDFRINVLNVYNVINNPLHFLKILLIDFPW